MTRNKNQKKYNKAMMQSGLKSQQYINETLGLLNNYSTNYMQRLDDWTNKLNNKYLEQVADKYLAQNAAMLRGQGQFGSNSSQARQQEENAYSQQNALANIQNQQVAAANQLQMNELNALTNNYQQNVSNRSQGAQAAANLDRLSNSWMNVLGQGLSAVGSVAQAFPGVGKVVGGALKIGGNILSSQADPTQYQTMTGNAINEETQTLGANVGDAIQKQFKIGNYKEDKNKPNSSISVNSFIGSQEAFNPNTFNNSSFLSRSSLFGR